MKKKHPRKDEAAFIMEDGDRFHSIIVSDDVLFEASPGMATVITFFVIRRASGSYDIVNINRTFKGDTAVSRTVQIKAGISGKAIGEEIDNVRISFALGIEKETGFKLKWNVLGLSGVEDCREQVLRIREWDRVGVRSPIFDLSADLPPGMSLN